MTDTPTLPRALDAAPTDAGTGALRDPEPWHPVGFAPGDAGGRRPLAAGRRAVGAALRGDQLHVCAVDDEGRLWHTLRHPDSSWQALGVDVSATVGLGPVRRAAATPAGARLLVTAVGHDGRTRHVVRFADGTWRRGHASAGGAGPVADIALATDCQGRRVHVLAVDADGRMWHAARRVDGVGREAFAPVTVAEGLVGKGHAVGRVAAAMEGGRLQVVVSTTDSGVWHGRRAPDGSWDRFEPVAFPDRYPDPGARAGAADPGHAGGGPVAAQPVAVAASGGRAHVLTVEAGRVWHAVRSADGAWRPSVGAVDVVDAFDTGCAVAAGITARTIGDRLHALVTTVDGRVCHTARTPNGRWHPAFGDAFTVTDPPPLVGVAC